MVSYLETYFIYDDMNREKYIILDTDSRHP